MHFLGPQAVADPDIGIVVDDLDPAFEAVCERGSVTF